MGWDKGLSYDYILNKLLRHYKTCTTPICKCYTIVYLTQLRNGSRISESIRAVKLFLETGKTEVEVEVSKTRKKVKRLMVYPIEYISFNEVYSCIDVIDHANTRKLSMYIKNCIDRKLNTHTLRYAFITKMVIQGINPLIVARITKHQKLDTLLTYTQELVAREILRNTENRFIRSSSISGV